MRYSLRGGRLFERLLAKAFNKVVQQIAENLKAFYETGRTQNPDRIETRLQERATSE
jgi:hypothetical protein